MLFTIAKLIALSYGLFLSFVYIQQENFIFFYDHIPKEKPKVLSYDCVSEKVFTTKDSTKLYGVYLESDKRLPLAIYFGGNAENAVNFIEIAKFIKGYNFLVFNYRGYGLSEGKPSKKALLSDALEIYDKFGDERSILVGRSLGSSVASYVASAKKVHRLFLITPFDSLASVASTHMKAIPVSMLLKHNFNTMEYVRELETPVYMLVAKNDLTVTKRHSDNLKKQIKNLKYYKEVDADHNSIDRNDLIDFIELK